MKLSLLLVVIAAVFVSADDEDDISETLTRLNQTVEAREGSNDDQPDDGIFSMQTSGNAYPMMNRQTGVRSQSKNSETNERTSPILASEISPPPARLNTQTQVKSLPTNSQPNGRAFSSQTPEVSSLPARLNLPNTQSGTRPSQTNQQVNGGPLSLLGTGRLLILPIGLSNSLSGPVIDQGPVIQPQPGFSSGCRFWCRTPLGQICCDSLNQPPVLGIKPGHCPVDNLVCPGVRAPVSCSSDVSCPGKSKCCFNTCLQYHVCQAPLSFQSLGL